VNTKTIRMVVYRRALSSSVFDGSARAVGAEGKDRRTYRRLLVRARAKWHLKHEPIIARSRKRCSRCTRTRKIKFFNLALGQPDCVRPYCRDCDRQIQKVWERKKAASRKPGPSRVKLPVEIRTIVRKRVLAVAA